MHKTLILLAVLICAGARPIRGANTGAEVVVVYNSQMPESKDVAAYYAQRRGVPASQVFGLKLSSKQDISRAEFKATLQQPLAGLLKDKHLWHIAPREVSRTGDLANRKVPMVVESSIRYAVLCYGVPVRIEPDESLKEPETENLREQMRRNEAAVDSELALLPILEQNPPIGGPARNPVFSCTNAAVINPTNGILIVARLDGPSAAVARGLVDKALQAESQGLWGRAYFDLRNLSDPAYKLGDQWIGGASEICRHLGFETVVDEKPETFPANFPMSQIAVYMGWYAENVCGPFAQPTVEFMPGAFAYHLHSYSAADIRSATSYWVGPLLAKGATATMGCVWEPYLSGTPDVAVFASRWLYEGFTFGEAASACQMVLSWMTTVVGDPLYRPFAKNPDQLRQALEQSGSDLAAWAYLRFVDLNLANGRPVGQMIPVLEQVQNAHPSAILAEKLGDLYTAQGKPASAVALYQRALALNPSPQERLRLRLTLGERLPTLATEEKDFNGEAAAYEDYQALLRECPDYPDKLGIYQKILPLARKLNKIAEADNYENQIRSLTTTNK